MYPKKTSERLALAIAEKNSPWLVQYLTIKREYPGYLVAFRLGDFYQFFFEDAKKINHLMATTLVSRNTLADKPIPMTFFPMNSAKKDFEKLEKLGASIAVCEQLRAPRPGIDATQRRVGRLIGLPNPTYF